MLIGFNPALRQTRPENMVLDPEVRQYAAFADAAYAPDRMERLRERDEGRRFRLVPKLSDEYIAVFESRDEVVTAVRGTVPTDPQDLAADVGLVVGTATNSTRFQHARDRYEEVLRRFPDKQHTVTGHSLGGSIAMHLNQHYPVDQVYLYNPGSAPMDPEVRTGGLNFGTLGGGIARRVGSNFNLLRGDNKKMDNVHGVFVQGDPISVLGQYQLSHTTVLPAKANLNPHTLEQFF